MTRPRTVATPRSRERRLPTPFDRSYWVDPGRLLAGFFPGGINKSEAEQKLSALLDVGVRCMINLMEEHEVNHHGRPFRPYTGLLMKLAAKQHAEAMQLRCSCLQGLS